MDRIADSMDGGAAGRDTVATADSTDDSPTPGQEGGRPATQPPNTGLHGMTPQRPIDATPVKSSGDETVFHPSWRSRRVVTFWVCTFLVTTLAWWTFTGIHLRSLPAGNTLPGTLVYPIFWATMWTWSRVLRGTSLTISATRLVYATRSGSTFVRWRDIAGIGRGAGPGRWLLGEGLLLSTPPDELPEWRWRLLSWRAFPIRFIPLDQFGANWREGRIGWAIRHYAPTVLATNGGE